MQSNYVPGQGGYFLLMDIISNCFNLLMIQGWRGLQGPFSALEDGQRFPQAHSDSQRSAEEPCFFWHPSNCARFSLEHSAGKTKYTKDTFKKVWELELAALCHTVILLQEITAVTLDPLQKFLYLSLSGCEMCTSLSGEESPTDARGISHLARRK